MLFHYDDNLPEGYYLDLDNIIDSLALGKDAPGFFTDRFNNGDYLVTSVPSGLLELFGDIVERDNAVVAGGVFKDILRGKFAKDCDLYYFNQSDFKKSVESFAHVNNYDQTHDTDSSIGFKLKDTSARDLLSEHYDLIKKFWNTPLEIIDSFDFTVTKMCLYKNQELDRFELMFHKDFFNDLVKRRLAYGEIPESKMLGANSLERIQRYIGYGYSISEENYKRSVINFFNSWPEELGECNIVRVMENIKSFSRDNTIKSAISNFDLLVKEDAVGYSPTVRHASSYCTRMDYVLSLIRCLKGFNKFSRSELRFDIDERIKAALSDSGFFAAYPVKRDMERLIRPTNDFLEFLEYIVSFNNTVPKETILGLINIVYSLTSFVAINTNHKISPKYFVAYPNDGTPHGHTLTVLNNLGSRHLNKKISISNASVIMRKILEMEETVDWFNGVREYFDGLFNSITFNKNFTYNEYLTLIKNKDFRIDLPQSLFFEIYVDM